MDHATKQKAITDFAIHEGDTGSADVQISVCTARINEITEHLKRNPKDKHSRKGLIGLVNQRRKFLKYLARSRVVQVVVVGLVWIRTRGWII